jgi:hypothetical protein
MKKDGMKFGFIIVLQHVESVERIINNAKRAAPVLRLFEWIDIPPHDDSFELTKDMLDGIIGRYQVQVR